MHPVQLPVLRALPPNAAALYATQQAGVHCHLLDQRAHRFDSSQYTGVKYVLAQLDYLQEEAADVSFTPTYSIHNAKGKKVDEFYGVNPQKLDDHLWLHS